jgi:hypothetical protein
MESVSQSVIHVALHVLHFSRSIDRCDLRATERKEGSIDFLGLSSGEKILVVSSSARVLAAGIDKTHPSRFRQSALSTFPDYSALL